MPIFDLFPTALGSYDLGRDFTDQELKLINSLDTKVNAGGNHVSLENRLLDKKPMHSLKKWLDQTLKDYFKTVYCPMNDVTVEITQSWCNFSYPGEMHHKHYHPNSLISGVLYIQADAARDRIWFHRDDRRELKTPKREFNPWNSDTWWMESVTGRLYLFPSYVSHKVEPVDSDQVRISLSFNTFPKGDFGEESAMTGLYID
jgi:uncharacterized protein (TIGR02466 family)